MHHDTLAFLADLYTPILLLAITFAIWKQSHKLSALVTISIYMTGVYGMMLLDQFASLWPRAGLDYSTHTALAAVCVWFLWQSSRRFIWIWSLMGYFALIIHLRYHTLTDILSTLAVIVLWISLHARISASCRAVKSDNSDSSQSQAYGHDQNSDRRQ